MKGGTTSFVFLRLSTEELKKSLIWREKGQDHSVSEESDNSKILVVVFHVEKW